MVFAIAGKNKALVGHKSSAEAPIIYNEEGICCSKIFHIHYRIAGKLCGYFILAHLADEKKNKIKISKDISQYRQSYFSKVKMMYYSLAE